MAPTTPTPDIEHKNEDNVSLFMGLSKLLEEIFDPSWLTRQAHFGNPHPAVAHWALCQEYLKSEGVLSWQRSIDTSKMMADAILGIHWLIVASEGNPQTFGLGNFLNYGHADILARLRNEAKTPGGYSGVMTELMFAGWCVANNVNVVASSAPSVADFVVRGLDGADECCVECKSLEVSSSIVRRVKARLSEANTQIKATSDKLPGVALVRLNNVWVNDFSDLGNQPTEVTASVIAAKRVLNAHLRSVSSAAVLWDEFNLRDSKERPGVTYAILRRHSLWVDHQAPRLSFRNVSRFHELGATLVFEIPKVAARSAADAAALLRADSH